MTTQRNTTMGLTVASGWRDGWGWWCDSGGRGVAAAVKRTLMWCSMVMAAVGEWWFRLVGNIFKMEWGQLAVVVENSAGKVFRRWWTGEGGGGGGGVTGRWPAGWGEGGEPGLSQCGPHDRSNGGLSGYGGGAVVVVVVMVMRMAAGVWGGDDGDDGIGVKVVTMVTMGMIKNERLLEQVINKDIMNIIMNSTIDNAFVNVHERKNYLKLETELLIKKDFIEKETYDKLFRSYTTLEKHCISLEGDTQLNQEIFQRDNSVLNQSAPNFDQYFEFNELKTQSQEKDMVIRKLKEIIKSLSGNMNEEKIKTDIEEIETINIEFEHRVSKLIAENEHLKQTYKQLYDSIKPTHIRSKEQCDALVNQVNQKSMEIYDLNVSLQEKDLVITALKDELRKLKGKDLADNVVTKNTIAPAMLKIDEQAAILREIVEQGKSQNPLNNFLDSDLDVTLKNKDKRVRFTEPVTSSRNTNTKTASSSNLVSNKPMLSSTGVKSSISASGSQPSGNTKKDKIQQTPSSTQKNKVEAHSRTVKSSLKNKNCVVEPIGSANVQHSKLNVNFELLCVKCNGCMLFDNHDLCVLDFINDVNAPAKSKSIKKNAKRKVWKPIGNVFTNIGYTWRPTGQTFTIVKNACPLTRITTTAEVPLRKPAALENNTPKPVVTLVYSRKPRKSKTNVPVSKPKIIKSISANNKEPSKS
ncbi:hypothetical protein Tco_0210782 [Tanacetum coccineum]